MTRWEDYPEAMARKVAMGKALAAAGKRKRGKRARSPLPKPDASQRRPTRRQVAFLEGMHVLTEALGRAPNASEIARHMGITQPGAHRMLAALAAKGLARDVPKVVSSGQWSLTPDGDRALELK